MIAGLPATEAESLNTMLRDKAWSLAAIVDTIEAVTGKRLDRSAIYRHRTNHSD